MASLMKRKPAKGKKTRAGLGPIIARKLFEDDAHQKIKDYVNTIIPMLPVSVDDNEFVRHYMHNPGFFVNIHHQLTDFASEQFGVRVKPSYCFLSMYKESGICPLHIDRPQCRYTIDYLIQITQDQPWPILIADEMTDEKRASYGDSEEGHPKGREAINQRISAENWHRVDLEENDAVLYSGTNSWHYRPERLQATADLIFFHFVPEDFDGSLD